MNRPSTKRRVVCPECGERMMIRGGDKQWYCESGHTLSRHKARSQAQRDAAREKGREWRHEQQAKRRDLVRRIKSYGACADCNGTFHFAAMDFDHVRGEKVDSIARMVNLPQKHSLDALLDEIAKCDLVCANCHRVRTYERIENCCEGESVSVADESA